MVAAVVVVVVVAVVVCCLLLMFDVSFGFVPFQIWDARTAGAILYIAAGKS